MKFLSLDLKGVDTDGTFEGYASLFHREDLSHDVVMPGAFAQSLAQRGTARRLRVLRAPDGHARRHCAGLRR
jgi:phage head maturation protease